MKSINLKRNNFFENTDAVTPFLKNSPIKLKFHVLIYYYNRQGSYEDFLFRSCKKPNRFSSKNKLFPKIVVVFVKIQFLPNPPFRPFAKQYFFKF